MPEGSQGLARGATVLRTTLLIAATARFARNLALAKGVEGQQVNLHAVLLAIDLERPRREKRDLKVGVMPAG